MGSVIFIHKNLLSPGPGESIIYDISTNATNRNKSNGRNSLLLIGRYFSDLASHWPRDGLKNWNDV
jgi:hypothetical protein